MNPMLQYRLGRGSTRRRNKRRGASVARPPLGLETTHPPGLPPSRRSSGLGPTPARSALAPGPPAETPGLPRALPLPFFHSPRPPVPPELSIPGSIPHGCTSHQPSKVRGEPDGRGSGAGFSRWASDHPVLLDGGF